MNNCIPFLRILFCFMLMWNSAFAQDDCRNNTPYLEMNFNYGQNLDFNFNTISDYQNGVSILNGAALNFFSNFPWQMSISSNNQNYFQQLSGQEITNMPVSVLSIKTSFLTNWISLKSSPTLIAFGKKTGPCKSKDTDFESNGDCTVAVDGSIKKCRSFTIDFKLDPKFNYSEGVYSTVLVYTITPN